MPADEIRFQRLRLRWPWRRWVAGLAAACVAFTAGVARGFDYDTTRAPALAAALAAACAITALWTAYGVLTWLIARRPPVAVLDVHGASLRVTRARRGAAYDLIVPWAQITGVRLDRPAGLAKYLCLDVADPQRLLAGFDGAADGRSSGLGTGSNAAVGSETAARRLADRLARFGTPLAIDVRRYGSGRSRRELDTTIRRLTYGRLGLSND